MTTMPAPAPPSPSPAVSAAAALRQAADFRSRVLEAVAPVIVGQRRLLDDLLVAVVSGGHCLLEGVPGLAKTLLVKSLARALALDFGRIQFTPDLMPADITGTEVLDEDPADGRRRPRFLPGPVFHNLILADEINRAPPKTQSALLEAMQEGHVTAGGTCHPLPRPFLVLATRNPIDQEGTYPLPEGQLDRFMFLLRVDYPTGDDEFEIVRRSTGPAAAPIAAAVERETLAAVCDTVRAIPVSDHVMRCAVGIVRATRPGAAESPEWLRGLVRYGAGPRAAQFLVLAAKAAAALDGRPCVEVRDVHRAAAAVLRHRLVTTFEAESEGIRPDAIIDRLLGEQVARSAAARPAAHDPQPGPGTR
jgi:MoxR-like ATPase